MTFGARKLNRVAGSPTIDRGPSSPLEVICPQLVCIPSMREADHEKRYERNCIGRARLPPSRVLDIVVQAFQLATASRLWRPALFFPSLSGRG